MKRYHIILIVTTAFIVYANTLNNDFAYDDDSAIVRNDRIRNIANIGMFFTRPVYTAGNSDVLRNVYRPLLMTTFAINYKLGGLNVPGYHIVNILFHAANAVLVYMLIIALSGMEITGKKTQGEGGDICTAAFFASLLFAVHPVNTEAVNYIWQRSVLMVTFFCLLSVVLFIRYLTEKKSAFLFFSAIVYILALMSKEIAITLPLLFMLVDWYFISGFRKDRFCGNLKKCHLPFIAITLLYLFFRLFNQGIIKEFSSPDKAGVFNYLLMQFRVIIGYFKLIIIPEGLSIHHFFPVSESIMDIRVMAALVMIVLAVVISIRLIRVSKTISLFILWFFIALLPTSSILPLRIIMNEHRIYLPGIGIIAAFVILLFKYVPDKFRRKVLPTVLTVILIAFSVLTLKRNTVWRNGITLWSEVLKKNADSVIPLNNRGCARMELGFLDMALADFNSAVELNPGVLLVWRNRGRVYNKKGLYVKAIADFNRVIAIDPENSVAYVGRGIAWREKGLPDKAVIDYDKAIELNPKYSKAYNSRGTVFMEQGLLDMALADFDTVLKIDPKSSDAYYNRGIIFMKEGDFDKAISEYNKSIRMNSEHAKAYNNRGVSYHEKGLYDKEIADYSRAISIDPEYSDAYLNRGIAYLEGGLIDKALTDFNRAVEIDPENKDAYISRGIIYGMKGIHDKAMADFNMAIKINPGDEIARKILAITRGEMSKGGPAK